MSHRMPNLSQGVQFVTGVFNLSGTEFASGYNAQQASCKPLSLMAVWEIRRVLHCSTATTDYLPDGQEIDSIY